MIYYKEDSLHNTGFRVVERTFLSDFLPDETGNYVFVIDVETDEKDNFVGMSLINVKMPERDNSTYYFTNIHDVKSLFWNLSPNIKLVGHNLKGDVKWLKSWGVDVHSSMIYFDTMLASYVRDATKKSHGLKQLAKELFDMVWTTYKELTGKGKGKKTLNLLPTETVRDYCCADCLATYKLWIHFINKFLMNERKVFYLEMFVTRLLYEMECKGVCLDTTKLNYLCAKYSKDLETLKEKINLFVKQTLGEVKDLFKTTIKDEYRNARKHYELNGTLNLNSHVHKRMILDKVLGFKVKSTDKKYLQQFKKKFPFVQMLADYSELFKFLSFLNPLSERQTVSTTYNQVVSDKTNEDDSFYGIRSGRISSSNPNLQQIPVKTERGKELRECFTASKSNKLLIFDYSQIELRMAAYFSKDAVLSNAFLKDEDIHEATAKALGVDRYWGKTANFLLAFGGSPYRLASTLEIDEKTAKDFYYKYWRTFKGLYQWKQKVITETRTKGYIRTLLGRNIKIVDIMSPEIKTREGAERQACNYIIQGSTAEIMKVAMREFYEHNLIPSLFVHDEFIFDVAEGNPLDKTKESVYNILMKANELIRPIPVKVGVAVGTNWGSK